MGSSETTYTQLQAIDRMTHIQIEKLPYLTDNLPIDIVHETKYLGVVLDSS